MGCSVVHHSTSCTQACADGESLFFSFAFDIFFNMQYQALGVMSAILMLLWKSEGITIADLNSGSVNFRNPLNGFVGISLLTALYSIGMASLGISGLHLPPFLVLSK